MANLYEMILSAQQGKGLQEIAAANEKSARFGLVLTEEETTALLDRRFQSLKLHKRVEMGGGILPKLIDAFCDSQYLEQDNYFSALAELQDVFYLYKNESQDKITDDELLSYMKEQFEHVCYGSVDYLRETSLERFARAVRQGYHCRMEQGEKDEYVLREVSDESSQFSEETRWDRDLYWEALEELMH